MKRAAIVVAALALVGCAATDAPEPDPAAFLADLSTLDGFSSWILANPDTNLIDGVTNVVCNSEPELSGSEVHDVLELAYPDLMELPGSTSAIVSAADEHLC